MEEVSKRIKSQVGKFDFLLVLTVYIVKVFVVIGEFVAIPFRLAFRFLRLHFLALFYVTRHIALTLKSKQLPLFQKYMRPSIGGWVKGVGYRTSFAFLRLKNHLRLLKVFPSTPQIQTEGEQYLDFPEFRKRSRLRYRFVRIFVSGVIVSIFLGFIAIALFFYAGLPRAKDIGRVNYALTTHIYDRDNRRLFDFYTEAHRTPVKIDSLPVYIANATVAIEDKDFYRHHGVALWSGIIRAVKEIILTKGSGIQGGSTITQQLVKTALLSPERTFSRKIREILIALEVERVFSKRQILEMYLNQVPYGGNAYGIEEASQKYFGKSAKKLRLSEAALLAGLPQSPSVYSPFTNIEGAIYRRNQVLNAMREQNMISQKEYAQATLEKPTLADSNISIQAPHFVFFVRQYLERYFDSKLIDEAGFKVKTTLDLDIQNFAQKVLTEELAKIAQLNVTNGAILVTKPQTGEILAMVGSVDYFDRKGGEFNVTTGLRQPGSSIKPILYAQALDKGFTAASTIDDVPFVYRSPDSSEVYRPVNYDGKFHGRVTLRQALANSYNIPAVRIIEKVSVPDFLQFAKSVGIDTWGDPSQYGLSLALGGGDVTMTDMTEAFGVLANEGSLVDVHPVSRVTGPDGKVIASHVISSKKVLNPANAYIISDILADNQARLPAFGYGTSLEIQGYKVAVKTGTTDEKRDNWTIGYTPDYLVAVWVGNNDHTPMHPYLTSGVTGAAPIWHKVMQYLVKKDGGRWFEKPPNVVSKQCYGRQEYFIAGTENSVPCIYPAKKTPTP